MPTKYARLEENTEVIDVLYALALSDGSPKDISEKLNQNVNTVKAKIMFLRKSKVIIKNKWVYKLDSEAVAKRMLNAVNDVLKYYIGISKNKALNSIRTRSNEYFTKDLLSGIVKVFSVIYFQSYGKFSMREMAHSFISHLPKATENRLRKINPKLLELRRILSKIPTKEDLLLSQLKKI